jgi:hypothetical protein
MLILRLEKSLRVACGVGLLGLLVVQEKLWPWLLTAPDPPQPPVAAADPTSQAPPTPDKRANPRLPYILPDTPLSRWPASCFDQTLRQTAGDRDGVVSCGQQDPKPGTTTLLPAAGADALAWRRFQSPSGAVGMVADATAALPLGVSTAVRTCISRTGPPSAA